MRLRAADMCAWLQDLSQSSSSCPNVPDMFLSPTRDWLYRIEIIVPLMASDIAPRPLAHFCSLSFALLVEAR